MVVSRKLLCGFRVSHATRTCRKAAPFTDAMSTMENNNLALSKRARSTPAPNETVCISIADAHAPHTTLPCTIDDKNCLHTPVNQLPEPTTLRRLTICVVQRCLRVLSGARHQQRQTPTTKRRHGLKPCRRSETSAALAATRVPVRQTHQLPTQKVSQTAKHITRTTESQALQNTPGRPLNRNTTGMRAHSQCNETEPNRSGQTKPTLNRSR